MEYIGATGILVTFNHVPISNSFDFHFILSFAIDADPSSNAQNSKFSPYWADTLTPDSIAALKARHHPNVVPNVVKALATLFSWSLGKKVLCWYDPKDPQLWISNAFKSLRSIITTYHLDGIDIDYEIFRKGDSTFAFCIRELISMLKNESLISVATIAPFYTTARPYIELFNKYGGFIDFVNHQFYTDKVRSPQGDELLLSYEVNGREIQGDAFFEALDLLKKNGFDVNEIMIFSADASAFNNYYYERKSQYFLLNSTIYKKKNK
ncbi:hypothetical protein I3842_03G118300 [Carya illinoinensis]|uniref:GH18 domain-containing protein n=1 Tax=Carya illinoinensis TaxID=32201 RepID=A0A922JV56_CARIL|nr:hypothetical protein I3842_03G118300 [Carya illinoinensis]